MGLDARLNLFDLKIYRERVLPAYQAVVVKDDPALLITLLKEVVGGLDERGRLHGPTLSSKEEYLSYIDILEGRESYPAYDNGDTDYNGAATPEAKQRYVLNNIAPEIVQALCVPRHSKVNTEQDIGNDLASYLSDRSGWIRDVLTFAIEIRGGELEIAIGESGELFTKDEIKKFQVELDKISPPKDPLLRGEYENLRALLSLAYGETDLTLVISV